MSDVAPSDLPLTEEGHDGFVVPAAIVATTPQDVHEAVQAHLAPARLEASTRCAPQGEAKYDHWDPNDHAKHKQYDEIYHKMDDQDPHDRERYEHIMHSPNVSTEAKLNAIDAMELLHTDQRCDLVNR
ncbi:hypothetical protein JCM3766R1_006324 [Sporobolomyces carnicolor]